MHKQTATILKSIKREKKRCCQMPATNTKKETNACLNSCHVRLPAGTAATLLTLHQRFQLLSHSYMVVHCVACVSVSSSRNQQKQ